MSSERGVPLSALCPKFLHSNSTSHIWPFSAIAELIDNGYDPDVNAKQFWIDKTQIKEEDCLIFMDNGKGLNSEKMLKMLSFGYSDKEAVNGVLPIGIYGNGFKSGSMRLGKDAIVFSKSEDAMCVGMLSQSYLKEIEAQQISVPIVSFNQATPHDVVEDKHEASLQDILRYSPFETKDELITEILAISSTPMGSTGTRIIIWNLRKTTDGSSEFDFVKDKYDIRIPTEVYYETISEKDKQDRLTSSIPENETKFSLRAYCSILYLKPRMQIILRGQKVKTQLISKSLAHIEKDHYRPNFLSTGLTSVIVPITFGYNTKSKDHYGIMMYHKNRLIKAYERVGCQLKANNKGVGVIGVVECNFLDPTHNKQDFLNTDNYRKTMNNLGIKLEEYWKEISYKRTQADPSSLPVEDTNKRPDQNWVQCDLCLRWRKLPDGVDSRKLPEKWFCHLNPDPQFRTCLAPEEAEDSDDEQPYQKTFRKQERADKRKQKEEKDRIEEELLNMKRQLNQQTVEVLVHTPSTPKTPRTGPNIGTPCGGAASSPHCSSKLSQAACSPSTSSSLPVISAVRSLATTPSRLKRTQPESPACESKRPRLNRFRGSIHQTSSSEGGSPAPASTTVKDKDCVDISDDISDDDDVIIISEVTSVPKKSVFDLSNVKTERHNDTEISTETAAVGTGPSPPPPPEHASTTTQTQPPGVKVKDEEERKTVEEDVKKEGEMEGSEQSAPPANQQHTEEAASCSRPDLTAPESPALDIYNMSDAQRQQDELMELMQATAHERDSLKDQVQQLTQQLSDMELQLSKTTVNKECKNQASQSEPTEDYRSQYEQVKREVAELRRENDTLLAAAQQAEDKPSDEVLSQINALMRDVEQRTSERDDMNSKLVVVEEQCVNLVVQCQLLELKLEEKKANPEEGPSTEQSTACDPGTSREAERSGGAEDSSTASGSDQTKRLADLRHKIGRLLVPFYPDLDFSQVNYECDVIDGMFELYLQDSGK